jgi:hypothetical protein
MLKVLFLVAMLFVAPAQAAWEGNRAERMEQVKQLVMKGLAEQKVQSSVLVVDTGKDIDIGDGDAPMVILKLPEVGRECVLALHPTDPELVGVVSCDDTPRSLGM